MPYPLRWLPGLALLAGCYTPHDAVVGDEETGASESSGSTGASATTTTSTSASSSTTETGSSSDEETSADTTAADTGTDLPPELSSFSVNGSDAPAEILEAEIVEIQVAAVDDVGIDRVELYDGDTLIASFTEPPYHTELLVTSADNGGHSYTAIAYDTAEQSAEAGPIPLSIGIDGGALLELQNAGFEATAAFGVFGPVVAASDDTIFVAGSNRLTAPGFTRFRLATTRLTFGLSSTGTSYYPTNVTASSAHHEFGGRATPDDDGDLLVPVAVRPNGGSGVLHLLSISAANGLATDVVSFGAESQGALAGFATLLDGELAGATGPARVARYEAADQAATWTTDAGSGLSDNPALMAIATDAEGAVVVAGVNGTDAFVRKLSPDGDILWTRNAPDVAASGAFHTAFAAVSSSGEVCLALSVSEDDGYGHRLVTYDDDGTPLQDVIVAAGSTIFLSDLAYDPQNRIVLTAVLDEASPSAWIGRYDADGSEIWSGALDLDSNDATATDLVALPDGRLYATGLRDTVAEFLSTTGDVWVAELAL